VKLGVNRTVWDLTMDPFKEPPRDEPRLFGGSSGPEVLPGAYKVTISYKDKEASPTLNVVADPRESVSAEDRKAKWDAIQQAGHLQESAAASIDRILTARADVDFVVQRANKLGEDEKKTTGA